MVDAPPAPRTDDVDEAPEDDTPQPVLPVNEEPEPEARLDEAEDEPEHDSPAKRPIARKARGRASVPTWDEIMFGGGRGD